MATNNRFSRSLRATPDAMSGTRLDRCFRLSQGGSAGSFRAASAMLLVVSLVATRLVARDAGPRNSDTESRSHNRRERQSADRLKSAANIHIAIDLYQRPGSRIALIRTTAGAADAIRNTRPRVSRNGCEAAFVATLPARRARGFASVSKSASKVLNLRADSKSVIDVSNFRRG